MCFSKSSSLNQLILHKSQPLLVAWSFALIFHHHNHSHTNLRNIFNLGAVKAISIIKLNTFFFLTASKTKFFTQFSTKLHGLNEISTHFHLHPITHNLTQSPSEYSTVFSVNKFHANIFQFSNSIGEKITLKGRAI